MVGEPVGVRIDIRHGDAPEEFVGATNLKSERDCATAGDDRNSDGNPARLREIGRERQSVLFTEKGWPGDGDGFRGDEITLAELVRFAQHGGNVGSFQADEAVVGIRIEGIGAGDGFLDIGPAVAVRVGLGIETLGEQLAVVVGPFPKIAQAVIVGVENGEGGGRCQKPQARDNNDEEAFHFWPTFSFPLGVSMRQ